MKFTRNHYRDRQKQINGQQFEVLGFDKRGQVKIKTKGKTQTVNPDALLYSDYRYVDTVHSSLGKTANYCIYSTGSSQSFSKFETKLLNTKSIISIISVSISDNVQSKFSILIISTK